MGTVGWTEDEDLEMDKASTEPPKPLEAGFYRATVAEASAERNPKTQKLAVKVVLKVSATHDGTQLDQKRNVRDSVPITKEAAFRAKQLAQAAGVNPPARSNFEEVSAFVANLLNSGEMFVQLKRVNGTGQHAGKVFTNVGRYLTSDQLAQEISGAGAAAAEATAAPVRAVRTRRAG